MTNELTFHCSLQILKDALNNKTLPETIQDDMSGTAQGASPGGFTASSSGNGTQVDLSEITTPGYAKFSNFDDTNYVDVGLVVSGSFHALFEVPAEKHFIAKFSRNVTAAEVYIRANTADCFVSVEAWPA